jgi:signal transduction histidine kinase
MVKPSPVRYTASPNLRFFRWWAALLLIISLGMGPFMVFTYGAVAFGALFALTVRDIKKNDCQCADPVNAITLFVTVIWFVYNLAVELWVAYRGEQMPELYLGIMALAYLYPPLIMHGAYLEERSNLPARRYWMQAIYAVYLLSGLGAAASFLRSLGYLKGWFGRTFPELQSFMFGLFILSVVYSIIITTRTHRKPDRREWSYRQWNVMMLVLACVIFVGMLAIAWKSFEEVKLLWSFMLVCRSLPLCFLFVGTYHQRRFAFFDVFIKQGTYLFLLFVLLVGYFRIVAPIVERSSASPVRPWFFAVALLPLLLALPWCYRRLDGWLDRAWLGRSYSTVKAVKFFLNGIQEVTTGTELIRHTEERLSEIFQAGVSISLDGAKNPTQLTTAVIQEVSILNHGRREGVIRMGPRPNDTPYFSSDISLMGSLADIFASLLENVRLQEKKQEQERKEQDLQLHASRSELKALRAQVNPHFLFNALNAIAGLIHRDPSRAEETVEQLAEVFRYTLKRSEKEWVRLEDELDFVRSYLEVEQARFGERLVVHMEVDEGVRQETIPTMMIQTLVENAVKHGVASVRGVGIIEIRARRLAASTRIEVVDNGPGFPSEPDFEDLGKAGSGYGLRNLLQRLNAHYGAAAELEVSRDSERQMTVVAVELPAHSTSAREVSSP